MCESKENAALKVNNMSFSKKVLALEEKAKVTDYICTKVQVKCSSISEQI